MIEVNVYGSRVVGPAETEMGCELGSTSIDSGLNLTRMYREAMSPDNADPLNWAFGSGWPLVSGYARYARLAYPGEWWPEETRRSPETIWERSQGVIDVWDQDVDDWSRGDITTLHLPIALAYALYLDRA